MTHGRPDWGTLGPTKTVYTLEDMAELAARLGSPVIFDRRGNVVFIEDFNGSLARVLYGTQGAGASISISNERAQRGDFSCEMVTGDAIDDWAIVRVRLPYPVLSKMGMGIGWYHYMSLRDLNLESYLFDGTKRWDARVRWVCDTGTWEYYDYEGNWIALSPEVWYYEGETAFNSTKLVVDYVNKEYVRLIANNLSWDLTGKALYSIASATAAQLVCDVVIYTRLNLNSIIYLDNIIVTQNEP